MEHSLITNEKYYLCPICKGISFFFIFNENINVKVYYECINNHKGFLSLNEFLKTFVEIKSPFCSKDNKNFEKYCVDCKQNLCPCCINNHEKNHKIEDLANFTLNEINDVRNFINFFEKNIKELKEQKLKIFKLVSKEYLKMFQEEFEKYISTLETEIEISKNFLNFYLICKQEKKISYEIYSNIKNNISDNFHSNKIDFSYITPKNPEQSIHFFRNRKNYLLYSLKNPNYKTIQNNNKENNKEYNKENNKESKKNKENKNNNQNFQIIQSIQNSSELICFICFIKENKFANCCCDGSIIIFNSLTFKKELLIKEHENGVKSLIQLNDGRLVSCSADKTINIIKLYSNNTYSLEKKINEHKNWIFNIIQLKNGNLVSCSMDKTIKIFDLNNNFKCINTLKGHKKGICDILQINNNEIVSSSFDERTIRFWDLNTLSNNYTLYNINTSYCCKILCYLNNDFFAIGGENIIYIIKNINHQICLKVESSFIWCLFLIDNGSLLVGDSEGNLIQYNNFIEMKVIKIQKILSNGINSICSLGKGNFIASSNKVMKIFK